MAQNTLRSGVLRDARGFGRQPGEGSPGKSIFGGDCSLLLAGGANGRWWSRTKLPLFGRLTSGEHVLTIRKVPRELDGVMAWDRAGPRQELTEGAVDLDGIQPERCQFGAQLNAIRVVHVEQHRGSAPDVVRPTI